MYIVVTKYNSLKIKKLEGLEGIRKRPEMYIGGTGLEGLFHCVSEVIDNSIDEALSNECTNINVKLAEGGCFIQDNGRGVPSELHYKYKKSTLLLVLTKLHAGGKFNRSSEEGVYAVSGGLHGIGLKCVNAVASKFKIKVLNSKFVIGLTFSKGVVLTRQKILCFSSKKGTFVFFKPDSSIFSVDKIQDFLIIKKIREVCFLNPGLKVNFFNYIKLRYLFFLSNKGVYDFIFFLRDKACVSIHTKPVCLEFSEIINGDFSAKLSTVFFYTTSLTCKIHSYVNCIDTSEGGTHLNFFKQNLPKVISTLNYKFNLSSSILSSSDIRAGLFGIVFLKMSNPKFNSQTKNKLSSVDIGKRAVFVFFTKLTLFFSKNQNFLKKIIEKSGKVFYLKNSLKKNLEGTGLLNTDFLYGKLADCSSNNFSKNELFIVEGDSAGGSAKQGRDRHYQAILSLKGKLINVQKSNSEKILKNKEVSVILKAIGLFSVKGGVINTSDYLKSLKYSKIILMTDADIDGEHIKTLLLTFFYKKLKFLIDAGIIYVANPPLYKVKRSRSLLSYNVNKFTFNKCIVNFFLQKKLTLYGEKRFFSFLTNKLSIILFKTHFLLLFLKKNFVFTWKVIFTLMFNKEITLNYFVFKNKKTVTLSNVKCLSFFKKKNLKKPYLSKLGFLFFLSKTLYKLKLYGLKTYFFLNTYSKSLFILENNLFFIKVNGLTALLNTIFVTSKKQFEIQRYKGLGEMNSDQLYNTSMSLKSRNITKIYSDSLFKNNLIFENLMGSDVKVRKSFIEKYYNYLQYV